MGWGRAADQRLCSDTGFTPLLGGAV